MNELNLTFRSLSALQRRLLLTASAAALFAATAGSATAETRESSQPTVWIELGGDMTHIDGQGNSFPVGFLAANSSSPVLQPITPLQAQRPIPFGFGLNGKITITPSASGWAFTAAVRYGRSNNAKHVDHQTSNHWYAGYRSGIPTPTQNVHSTQDFSDTHAQRSESHMILDFMAGHDVGLGLFGSNSTSVFNVGIRFAQFSSRQSFNVRARPDLGFKYAPITFLNGGLNLRHYHSYYLTGHASRNFRGIGPSLAWNGSAAVMGRPEDGQLSFDAGFNAALLFGRQKARLKHQDLGRYSPPSINKYYSTIYHVTPSRASSHSVTVPNIGGFAGGTFRVENFKLSVGYRADFFFGAMDGGVDTRKSQTLGFYGPFATISIGLP